MDVVNTTITKSIFNCCKNTRDRVLQSVDKDGCGTIVPQPIFLFLNYAAANKPENRLNTGPIIPFLCSILASFFKLRHA